MNVMRMSRGRYRFPLRLVSANGLLDGHCASLPKLLFLTTVIGRQREDNENLSHFSISPCLAQKLVIPLLKRI
jgi:hypothetical protein